MKILFLCFAVVLLSFQQTVNQSDLQQDKKILGESNKYENSESKFEIINIDSIETVYIIYAERRDSVVKIVSKKENLNDCTPIIKGQSYDLEIKSLLENSSSKRHIGGVKYNGILIKLEGDKVTWDLFICENLKGLCYAGPVRRRNF